jgi:hypothetical protein
MRMIRKMEHAMEVFLTRGDWGMVKWVDKNNAMGYY